MGNGDSRHAHTYMKGTSKGSHTMAPHIPHFPDIDACTNNACADHADCSDGAAPALDDNNGRTCTCQAGYENYREDGGCTGVLQSPS